jgi:hypothetical protein
MTKVLTTVATPSTQSQQSTSSVVMFVAAATTPLMAGQIFRDFLISTRSKKLPIHESIKKIASHIAHEYTMIFRVKDTISFDPFNGGTRQEWTRAIKTKGENAPRSMQRYEQRASGLVDTSVGDANFTVRDEVLKRVPSNAGLSLVKYKHGLHLIVIFPEDKLLLQHTGMMRRRKMLMFNGILVGLTGISIHITRKTLAALQDKKMTD